MRVVPGCQPTGGDFLTESEPEHQTLGRLSVLIGFGSHNPRRGEAIATWGSQRSRALNSEYVRYKMRCRVPSGSYQTEKFDPNKDALQYQCEPTGRGLKDEVLDVRPAYCQSRPASGSGAPVIRN